MSGRILVLDVTAPESLTLFLLEPNKRLFRKSFRGQRQNILLRIDQFLSASGGRLSELSGLALIEGGGSFSAVRQAAAVLNTIALVHQLTVAGFDRREYKDGELLLAAISRRFAHPSKEQFLTPIYGGEPNIRHSQ